MEFCGSVWLLTLLASFSSARWLPGPTETVREDCSTAWECCSLEFLSEQFNSCCYDHGCCPLCDKFWPNGCFYNNKNYDFGTVIEYSPKECKKLVCVAEVSTLPPYVKGIIMQTSYNSGITGATCMTTVNTICVDDFGILRAENEEWFVSSTCQQCWCKNGVINCQRTKRPCPLPPHPNCIAIPYGCCPKWDCGGEQTSGCPDPNSYGRECIQYFDQCQSDRDCGTEEHCCLVAGCGKECISFSHCVDNYGITRMTEETWCYPGNPENKYICLYGDIHPVEGSCISVVDPYTESPLPSDCIIRYGLNYSAVSDQFKTLMKIKAKLPLKGVSFFVEGFKSLVTGNVTANISLGSQDIADITSQAQTFKWDSVVPLLSTDTSKLQISALNAGELRLQISNVTSNILFDKKILIEDRSPSNFHQVAFRRTDPISIEMAQLGVAVGEATSKFISSLNLPGSAAAALTLLGDSVGCEGRFGNFLRPELEPPCNAAHPYRTLDGTCNNLDNNLWGAGFTKFRRILPPDYADGVSSLRRAKNGGPLPSARLVSTKVNNKPNEESAVHSFILVTFGQFLDHDLTATPLSRGYLGGPIKCCDDLSVKLDLAAISLNATKLALEEVKSIEQSIKTMNVQSELAVASKTLENLMVQWERLMENTQEVFNLTNLQQSLPFNSDDLKILNVIRPVSRECAPIPIPYDDEFYSCYGQTCMEFVRSSPAASCTFGPREQLNQISAYLDGSVIYGSRKEITNSLRQLVNGLLKVQVTLEGKILLPGEENPNDGCNVHDQFSNGFFCFRAGDGRVNEQILLVFMQTVWAREHNRIATVLKQFHGDWDDERLFQETRRIVVAELQHVTYNEFLPAVLGNVLMETLQLKPQSSDQYTSDYDETLDASIANSFATAAYRYGHSQISDFIQRINSDGVVDTEHTSSLFFNPFTMYEEEAVEELGRGSASYRARKVDSYFTEEVAGKLFKGSGKFGLDLVALNIQRGRDHGLPGYIHWKALCGEEVSQFSDLSSVMNEDVIDALQEVYSDLEDVDLYIGGVSEQPFLDGILGPTFSCIIADQFLRMKKGDRFWYEYKGSPGAFTAAQLKELHKVTLARILCNNIPELITIQPNAFKIPSSTNPRVSCHSGLIGDYSLSPWQTY
ncbi:peroxidasin homolog pxn-2-like isoform X2 [Macrobrachium nipponense]|uniref:peroxidasin homolog pxn-2-like isoform X2 n=1 Tax=Macrobrachium nipponense TaxID=159736 RepID=UPI0030C7A9BD